MIFKISGCNQMFCTQCHVAFDWRTLQIETGVVHNPHFMQWLQENGGNRPNGDQVVANNCNRQLDNNFIRIFVRRFLNETILQDKLNILVHIQSVELPKYRQPNQINAETENQDLHIKYLKNQIDKERLKVLVQQRHKRLEKNNEL